MHVPRQSEPLEVACGRADALSGRGLGWRGWGVLLERCARNGNLGEQHARDSVACPDGRRVFAETACPKESTPARPWRARATYADVLSVQSSLWPVRRPNGPPRGDDEGGGPTMMGHRYRTARRALHADPPAHLAPKMPPRCIARTRAAAFSTNDRAAFPANRRPSSSVPVQRVVSGSIVSGQHIAATTLCTPSVCRTVPTSRSPATTSAQNRTRDPSAEARVTEMSRSRPS